MTKKIQFGAFEGTVLIINSICIKVILGTMRIFSHKAGTAGWLLALFSSIVSIIAVLVILRLMKKGGTKDIFTYCREVSPLLEKIVGAAVILLFLLTMAVTLRYTIDLNKLVTLLMTPYTIIGFFLLLVTVFVVYAGYEAIARIHAFTVPIIYAVFILLVLCTTRETSVYNLFPILGANSSSFFQSGLLLTSTFADILILWIIAPFLQDYKTVRRVGICSVSISAALVVFSIFYYIMLVPYPVITELLAPVYQFSRLIQFNRFFQQFEAIFFIIWNLASLLYLANALFLASYSAKQVFHLKSRKLTILPFALIAYILSILPKNLSSQVQVYDKIYFWPALTGLAIPLVILIIWNLKRGGKPCPTKK